MRLKLKENPNEWRKFTAVIAVLIAGLSFLAYYKKVIGFEVWIALFILVAAGLSLCLWRPHYFRGFYRRGMTVTHAIGQFMGKVLLSVFFLLFLTPFAWALRLGGVKLMPLKPKQSAESYWIKSQSRKQFDRLF